jgi:hypothetical protein
VALPVEPEAPTPEMVVAMVVPVETNTQARQQAVVAAAVPLDTRGPVEPAVAKRLQMAQRVQAAVVAVHHAAMELILALAAEAVLAS